MRNDLTTDLRGFSRIEFENENNPYESVVGFLVEKHRLHRPPKISVGGIAVAE
jgi:hypothetical protein